jgi:hypothetical protein
MNNNLFILIGGSDEQNGDYSLVLRLARRGGTARWSSLKTAHPGDHVLIYIQRPHSALIAKAEVLAVPVKGKPGDYAYRAKVGNFELLPNRITLTDLKRGFPRWGFLRYPRGGTTVPKPLADRLWKLVHEKQSRVQVLISNSGSPERARALLERCRREVSEKVVMKFRDAGAGFGDAKTNHLVEQAAVNKVKRLLRRRGFTVISRERECIGYDLDARKGSLEIHVEVKGASGARIQFQITAAELKQSQADPNFRLMVVTDARARRARVHEFRGKQVGRMFYLTPLSFMAIKTF